MFLYLLVQLNIWNEYEKHVHNQWSFFLGGGGGGFFLETLKNTGGG